MKRTRLLAILAIAMVAGLLVSGCKNPIGLEPDTNIAWHWVSSPPQVFTIWAGQNQNAGTVTVSNNGTALHIEYKTTGDWKLEETHAHAATSLEGIPHSNGGMIPGKFDYSSTFSPPATEETYDIPFGAGWDTAHTIYIATHCVVAQYINGEAKNRQTGWSGPYDYPGRNWGKYIKFRLAKDVNLPKGWITMSSKKGVGAYIGTDNKIHYFDIPGAHSYWVVTLSGIGPKGTLDPQGFRYDVWDDVWRGWCGELDLDMQAGISYQVRLWSTADPAIQSMPRFQNNIDRWPNINYLLNHKADGALIIEVQDAIWMLRRDLDPDPVNRPLATQMYNDAKQNGGDFYPSTGDWIAVLAETPEEVQLCFIEVDP